MNMKRKVYQKDGQKYQEIKYKEICILAFFNKECKRKFRRSKYRKSTKRNLKNFVKLHNEEIERIKKGKCKNIKMYGILK